jgi:ArsR family metal-binding transcriptional regulator
MLIEGYDLEVFTPPCEPGAERYAARARLMVDISEILPYLNATLRGAVYHPSANALTWKKGGEPTCYTFALKLAVSQKKLADCSPLVEPRYTEKLAALEEIVIVAPAIG